MSALTRARSRIGAPGVVTLALGAVGAAVLALCIVDDSLPSLAALGPFLVAGGLVGLALDLAFGDDLDDAVASGSSEPLVTEGSRVDGLIGDDAADDEGGWSVLHLVSVVSIGGFTSVLPVTEPWFLGAVAGVVWTLAAIRICRALSPVTDGARPPPRGASPEELASE